MHMHITGFCDHHVLFYWFLCTQWTITGFVASIQKNEDRKPEPRVSMMVYSGDILMHGVYMNVTTQQWATYCSTPERERNRY